METITKLIEFSLSGFFTFLGFYSLLAMILYLICETILKIISNFFTLIQILIRGYPPVVIKEKQSKEELEETNKRQKTYS